MRKILLASLVVLLCGTQGISQRMFNIGIKAGANMNTPTFQEASEIRSVNDIYWGFNFGVSSRFKIKFVSIQPELLFSHNKTDLVLEDVGISEVVEAKFSEISIPVMVNFHFLKVMHAGLGPIYTFQFPSFEGGNHWDELKNNFNAGSFGVQFGLGFDIWRLYVDLNYQVGIGQYKSTMDFNGTTYNLDSRPNTLWLTVGFWFLNPKGKK